MSEKHLDLDVLLSLRDVMGDDYQALLEAFFSDSDERLRLLTAALNSGDVEQLKQVAHSFKGSSSNLGAQQLSHLCSALEQAAQEQQLQQVQGLLEQMQGEFGQVRSHLSAQISKH